LAESGHQPPERDDGPLDEQREQPIPLQPQCRDRVDGTGRLDVGLAAEHGDVSDHRPGPGPCDHEGLVAFAPVQLHGPMLDHVRRVGGLALPEQMSAGVLGHVRSRPGERGKILGAQQQVVRPAERAGQPGIVLDLG
jgi:hypothetical protein